MAELSQDEIDQAEWENPDNWSTIYFSSRAGSRAGSRWIYYLMLFFTGLGMFFGALFMYIIMAPK